MEERQKQKMNRRVRGVKKYFLKQKAQLKAKKPKNVIFKVTKQRYITKWNQMLKLLDEFEEDKYEEKFPEQLCKMMDFDHDKAYMEGQQHEQEEDLEKLDYLQGERSEAWRRYQRAGEKTAAEKQLFKEYQEQCKIPQKERQKQLRDCLGDGKWPQIKESIEEYQKERKAINQVEHDENASLEEYRKLNDSAYSYYEGDEVDDDDCQGQVNQG